LKKSPLIYDKATHEARKYWRDRLDAMSFAGHIALDHPRPKDGQQQLASLERRLDPEIHALLRRLSAGNPFLAYTALVSALNVCCHKYSGDCRVTIFSPATSESDFANLLPISSTLDGSSAFKDVLLATKDLLSSAFRNQQYPFTRMLLDLPDERRPRHLPMIAAIAGFHDGTPETSYDITVVFEVTDERTTATFRFDKRVYDESTLEHFFELLGSVLRQGLGDPTTRVADLRQDHAREAPAAEGADHDLRLHRLIEAEAAKHPENVAVVEGDRATTYDALNRDAERLATTLAGLALDVSRPIVILMDAGTEMIVTMLAVLKTGAAFAPIKLLSSAGGAIGSILGALDSECIICQPEHLADLEPFIAGLAIQHVVTVEYSSSLQVACHSTASSAKPPQESTAEPFNTACVVVESKSFITHAELISLFQWLNGRCGIGAGDRCLLSPGLGAAEQLYDTLGILSAGGTVDIADAADMKDRSRLAKRLLEPSITVWDLPTPLAQNLLADLLALHAERPHLQGPRNIFLSGEKQSVSLAETLAQCFPNAQITGLYASPTAGVWTTFFPFPADSAESIVAQPVPGVEHQVLNRSGEIAPLHAKGALHVKGSKTGLRAEALDRCNVTWLRGEDHCVVRYGCTVELTEIEAVLCRNEHIRAAEVVAVDSDQVVAFIIADPEQMSVETAADDLVLRGGVDLIPDRFILLDEFPLTADGAIDRDALVAQFSGRRADDSLGIAAEAIHQQLKGIWLDILQVDDVADDDSFFTRGGNSLKATLLIARIRDEFSVDLSVQKFFREPSTRAVALLIAAESANAANVQKGPDFKIVPRERYRAQLPELEGG
jgi:non-ribosomal peptide synthetase component F/acyl carrier protein